MDKGSVEQRIRSLIESICEEFRLELLELVYVPRRRRSLLRVTIDNPEGNVTLKDCEDVSRRVSRILDVEDPIPGSYQLEVSSPGFKRLLRIPKDLSRFPNQRVRIQLVEPLEGRTVWQGVLHEVGDPLVLSGTDKGEIKIPHELIQKANLDE
ncbi:ribosome maturation factor RimP [bacterium]|nr:ribosome maturation factor RimP [candidate division CSSED10-310 bacterium]